MGTGPPLASAGRQMGLTQAEAGASVANRFSVCTLGWPDGCLLASRTILLGYPLWGLSGRGQQERTWVQIKGGEEVPAGHSAAASKCGRRGYGVLARGRKQRVPGTVPSLCLDLSSAPLPSHSCSVVHVALDPFLDHWPHVGGEPQAWALVCRSLVRSTVTVLGTPLMTHVESS